MIDWVASWHRIRVPRTRWCALISIVAHFSTYIYLLRQGFSFHATSDAAATEAILLSPRNVVCTARRAIISPCVDAQCPTNIRMCTEYAGEGKLKKNAQARRGLLRESGWVMRVRKYPERGDGDVPYNDPCNALHGGIIQMFVYRVQL
jgi:hypothetical protein